LSAARPPSAAALVVHVDDDNRAVAVDSRPEVLLS
jgi:hypothetical protein